jgi:hypothetical protein
VICIGDEGELKESDKVLLIALSWVDRMIFLLPISKIGVVSGDNPLLLLRDVRICGHEKENQGLCISLLTLHPLPRDPLPPHPLTWPRFDFSQEHPTPNEH